MIIIHYICQHDYTNFKIWQVKRQTLYMSVIGHLLMPMQRMEDLIEKHLNMKKIKIGTLLQ